MRRAIAVGISYSRDGRVHGATRRTGSTISATSSPATFERALGLESDACALAVRFDGRCGYVHFAGLPPLCFVDDPAWLRNRAGDPALAGEVLAQAQGMLSWRLRAAERRLTGCALTPDGVVGGYDPL